MGTRAEMASVLSVMDKKQQREFILAIEKQRMTNELRTSKHFIIRWDYDKGIQILKSYKFRKGINTNSISSVYHGFIGMLFPWATSDLGTDYWINIRKDYYEIEKKYLL